MRRGDEPARAGHAEAEPLEVEREPGDERDERRRDAVDRLELAGHRLRDHVAEVRTDQHPEQQVSGQAREPEPPQQLAGHHRGYQREAERERRRGRIGPGGVGPADPQHGHDDQRDAEQALHAGASRRDASSDSSVRRERSGNHDREQR